MLKFDEEKQIASVQGALALRGRIEAIVDDICRAGFKNICWLGIGGTYASCLQAEVHMKERSTLEFFVENAAEYLTTGNRRVGEGTVVVISLSLIHIYTGLLEGRPGPVDEIHMGLDLFPHVIVGVLELHLHGGGAILLIEIGRDQIHPLFPRLEADTVVIPEKKAQPGLRLVPLHPIEMIKALVSLGVGGGFRWG